MDSAHPVLLEAKTTGAILDASHNVHRTLGFGYRELIYSLALERELTLMVDAEVAEQS